MIDSYSGSDVINKIADIMYEVGLVDSFIENISEISLEDDDAYELMIRWEKETDDAHRINLEEKMQDLLEKYNRKI